MTPQEALARITGLKHIYVDSWDAFAYDAEEVRDILAEVTPETDNRMADQAEWYEKGWRAGQAAAEPGCTLDRDALRQRLCEWEGVEPHEVADGMLDDILALARPVAGVTLTPEEADDLEAVLQLGLDVYMDSARGPRLRALAARLEAAQ